MIQLRSLRCAAFIHRACGGGGAALLAREVAAAAK
jgi:hypothetical protein